MRPRASVHLRAGPFEVECRRARVAIDAPDLLEPSARMLVQGPASLRRADDAMVAMTDAEQGVSK